jgi:DegV family protein with EDD domain
MEDKIRLVTDSSCDLTADVLEEYRIEVIPLIVHFGTEIFHDSASSVEEFWARMAGPQHAQTSQPSVGTFQEVFQRLVDQGKQVLCITLTSQHSGTFNAAQVAAQQFGEAVQVFDSLSLSMGLGWLVVTAAQAARAGRSMPEIVASLERLRDRISFQIVLNTLENLRRGGRADAFISVAERMTRALNIKVIINVVEGQLRLVSAARSFKRAVNRVLAAVEQMGPLEHLAVVHTRAAEMAEETAQDLARRTGFARERIWVRETGVVLSVHAGPGVIGVVAIPPP